MHVEMHPYPICSVCHSSFVEQLDPASHDDPRTFVHEDVMPDDEHPQGMPALLNLLFSQMALAPQDSTRSARSPAASPRNTTNREWQFSVGPGTMRISTGSSRLGAGGPGDLLFPLPPSSPYRPRSPSSNNPRTASPTAISDTFQQYILALLNGHDSQWGGLPGRAGDYVFTQEALDALMTQLMEGSQHTARPASQETRDALPRHVVTTSSDLLNRDCAVCKDDFEVGQKTVALPCTHSFHDECILPWLELNGTCPVCRTSAGGDTQRPAPPPAPRSSATNGSGSQSPHSPRSPRSPRSTRQNSNPNVPGGLDGHFWESLD
ncbi:hypothetical protein DACRYDRAFT_109569 [Dacryopinax primogenitus]|uniref:RING-type domain-containing protein n=1 Tax=Dacryopinax primogenitus (strain DJM 731) TaxID=1858805 RepID=M5G8R0_DACPD|nr:uncharacterized protein DACRYDRAFT_109569 [Dacryopinax primogenitus]EJU00153.1 hypothetical protein DACRYDRAFT_109569 [Dacryopinax primogenitus]